MAILSTRTINNRKEPQYQIRESCFLVKDYQRGYRWEPAEIIKLLDDLNEFESVGGTTYCLQPIVVKPCDADSSGRLLTDVLNQLKGTNNAVSCTSKSYWELVDGQQRLTTLILILDYCNKELAAYEPLPYEIRYCQLRPIDNYFIQEAMNTIKEWFNSFDYEESQTINAIKNKILQLVKIIWYEPDACESSEQIFKKINVGKIRLTSAELFKAFLINPKNTIDHNKKTLKEISYEWDQLERDLSDDNFWYFISNQQRNNETGIDYLLTIYCQQIIGKIKDKSFSDSDDLYSFMVISEYVEQNNQNKDIFLDVWDSIKLINSKLHYWYQNHELYHYVGYIIAIADKGQKDTAEEIIKLIKSTEGKTKSASRDVIKNEVINRINRIDLDEISYPSDRSKIFKTLLLFNLLTMIQSKTHAKFSFAEFKDKDNKWDIEHIHSQANDEELKKYKTPTARKEILEEFKNQYIEIGHPTNVIDGYIARCDGALLEDDWINIIHDVVRVFGTCDEHGLGNLTLLTAAVNRSYHNALFPIKRKVIIEKDKGEEFIPVCTKNVFLKMYTPVPQSMTMWNREDAESYLNAIKDAFEAFKQ